MPSEMFHMTFSSVPVQIERKLNQAFDAELHLMKTNKQPKKPHS